MPTCIRTVSSVVLSLLLMAIPVPPASPNAQGDIVQLVIELTNDATQQRRDQLDGMDVVSI